MAKKQAGSRPRQDLKIVGFYESPDVRLAIRQAAEDQGVTVSDWLRGAVRTCLHGEQPKRLKDWELETVRGGQDGARRQ